jgi:hypothetical protein
MSSTTTPSLSGKDHSILIPSTIMRQTQHPMRYILPVVVMVIEERERDSYMVKRRYI